MTLPGQNQGKLTDAEWNEMNALRKAIHDLPQAVSPEKMEEFTDYFVRSLKERGT